MKAFASIVKSLFVVYSVLACMFTARAQFTDGSTGLLQMPIAEVSGPQGDAEESIWAELDGGDEGIINLLSGLTPEDR